MSAHVKRDTTSIEVNGPVKIPTNASQIILAIQMLLVLTLSGHFTASAFLDLLGMDSPTALI